MRKLVLLVVLGFVASACGGGSGVGGVATSVNDVTTDDVTTDDVTTDDVTTDDVTTDDVTTDEVTTAAQDASASSDESNGPAAPDFELTLGDGSTFRLSDEQKPVYLVFWAEW